LIHYVRTESGFSVALACIAHNSLEICERCRLGSRILRLRRKIPLLFGEKGLETVCFDSFILKQALKQTPGVCLRAIQPAISVWMHMACDFCGLVAFGLFSNPVSTNQTSSLAAIFSSTKTSEGAVDAKSGFRLPFLYAIRGEALSTFTRELMCRLSGGAGSGFKRAGNLYCSFSTARRLFACRISFASAT
jgi:hypothetical protein